MGALQPGERHRRSGAIDARVSGKSQGAASHVVIPAWFARRADAVLDGWRRPCPDVPGSADTAGPTDQRDLCRQLVLFEQTRTVSRIRAHTDIPVAIGFGIRTPAQAGEASRVADGAIVGSALTEALAATLDGNGRATAATVRTVLDDVRALAEGVRAARAVAP